MIDIDLIVKWLKKTEGRDKLCKVLQYICRFLAAYLKRRSQYHSFVFDNLFQSIREARKLFRIFKSIDEFQAIVHLIFYGEEQLATVFHIVSKFLYFLYWIIDNISVAAKIKLFKLDWQKYHQIGLKIRFTALLLSVLTFFYEIGVKNPSKNEKQTFYLKLYKNLFDLLPAGKDSGLLNSNLDQKLVSFGGLASALISTYQIYQQP